MLDSLLEQPRRLLKTQQGGSLEALCEKLLVETTEVSTFAIASEILSRFHELDEDGKMQFFEHINDNLEHDPEEIASLATDYAKSKTPKAYKALSAATEPKRFELLRRLNQTPGATAELVRMRQDLRLLLKKNPDLARTDTDFSIMLRSWFNRGFLILRQITWDSPASILEKIIAYESVHEIDSWDDLRSRLLPEDRRCFAFFHPAMPQEPLIFVEVALSKGVPNSIQDVLAQDRAALDADAADTAVFYSISNCQAGLAGISFGNSLIKQVVRDISLELPNLRNFVTLSPIPGLRKWLDKNDLSESAESVQDLQKLTAAYLTTRNERNLPIDPVARFHLQNGAQILAIQTEADTSKAGIAKSYGMMVNYAYEKNKIADNLRMMEQPNKTPMSTIVRNLAKSGASVLEKAK